eukprot:12524486-Heterocapsa_arctica.AAC.1
MSWAARNAEARARRAPPGGSQVHVAMGPPDALWTDSQAHPRSEDGSAESESPASPPVEGGPPGPGDVCRMPRRDLQPGVSRAWVGNNLLLPPGAHSGPRGSQVGEDTGAPTSPQGDQRARAALQNLQEAPDQQGRKRRHLFVS